MNEAHDILIKDMDFETRRNICVDLDINQVVSGNDSRMLGDKLGLKPNEISLVWQGGEGNISSPAEQILRYWGVKKEATVRRLREVLVEMNREDVISHIDKKYPQFRVVDKQHEEADGPVAMEQEAVAVSSTQEEGVTGKEHPRGGAENSGPKSTAVKPVPEVFISYQWDIQDKVLELKEKLEENGITCWMDTSILRGGDDLNAEIEKGIRGCKLVVSCVTEAYCQSKPCQEEVALADVLKKPILPLLYERDAWPPTGPMALPLTKLLYVNCVSGLSNNTLEKILSSI